MAFFVDFFGNLKLISSRSIEDLRLLASQKHSIKQVTKKVRGTFEPEQLFGEHVYKNALKYECFLNEYFQFVERTGEKFVA